MFGAAAGIGAGTSIIGGTMQAIAAAQAAQAMRRAYEEELRRQQGYQVEGLKAWQGGVTPWTAPAAKTAMDTGRQMREGVYSQLNQTPLALHYGAFDPLVMARLGQEGATRAQLGSYGDWTRGAGIQTGRTQQELDRVANFARGTASIFPYRMYDAQHSWDQLAMIGAAIASLGGQAANYSQYYGGGPMQGGGTMAQFGSPYGAGYSGGAGNLPPYQLTYDLGSY